MNTREQIREQLINAKNALTIHQTTTEPQGHPCPECVKRVSIIKELEQKLEDDLKLRENNS